MMKRVLPRNFNNSKLHMLFVVMFFDSLFSIFCDAVPVGDQLLLHQGKDVGHEEGIKGLVFPEASSSRKLLPSSSSDDDGTANRIGTACSKEDIVILQGSTEPLPSGIPSYSVQILNVCVSGCSISDIHVSCRWFSSARLVNPTVFRRLYYDDCLVNDGKALGPGESLSFDYANSFSYPLSVSSVACCC